MTDLDRLHAVVAGDLTGRQVGKTFAACHTLAGMLTMIPPGETIAWVLLYKHLVEYIRPMLERVLNEHKIVFEWVRKFELQANGKRVLFLGPGEDTRQYDYFIREVS
jgi:hypothetical protein